MAVSKISLDDDTRLFPRTAATIFVLHRDIDTDFSAVSCFMNMIDYYLLEAVVNFYNQVSFHMCIFGAS